MKKTIILLLPLVIVAFSILTGLDSGTLAAETGKVEGAAPKIAVLERDFDFGRVLEGEMVMHAFVVENQGGMPLRIIDVQTSCGCTTARKPETIAPGTQGKIEVQGNTSGRGGGEFNKTIIVTSNDPNQPAIQLRLHGQVTPFARIEPRHIALQGKANDLLQAEAVITPGPGNSFKLLGTTLSEGLRGKISVTVSEKDGAFHILTHNLMTTPGRYGGHIVFETSHDRRPHFRRPRLTLYVKGHIEDKANGE